MVDGLFDVFDENGDGVISRREFVALVAIDMSVELAV